MEASNVHRHQALVLCLLIGVLLLLARMGHAPAPPQRLSIIRCGCGFIRWPGRFGGA